MKFLHSFRTENKLKTHEKVWKNKDFSGIIISSEKDKILQFNQYMKLDKIPYIIYADIESLIRKIDGCTSNPENSSTKKIGKHIRYGYSMSTIWGFDSIESKYSLYRGKDCMKHFCGSLGEHAKNIIDFERKKMLTLTKEELKSPKVFYICAKGFIKKIVNDKNYRKVRNHYHYTVKYGDVTHSLCNLKSNVPNEILIRFHNGSNYDIILSLKN